MTNSQNNIPTSTNPKGKVEETNIKNILKGEVDEPTINIMLGSGNSSQYQYNNWISDIVTPQKTSTSQFYTDLVETILNFNLLCQVLSKM